MLAGFDPPTIFTQPYKKISEKNSSFSPHHHLADYHRIPIQITTKWVHNISSSPHDLLCPPHYHHSSSHDSDILQLLPSLFLTLMNNNIYIYILALNIFITHPFQKIKDVCIMYTTLHALSLLYTFFLLFFFQIGICSLHMGIMLAKNYHKLRGPF